MAIPQLDRLQTALATSGLSQRDNATFQVISQLITFLRQVTDQLQADIAGGGSGGVVVPAITALTTDVVATGPGSVPATIQPHAVTYSKIQQANALRLIGNATALLADVMEIELGVNLEFDGTTLNVVVPGGGGTGIQHKILSETHLDSVPADAVAGDLIYAIEGDVLEGVYWSGYLLAPIVEDFTGIRVGYMPGYHGIYVPTNSMGYCPPELDFIVPTYIPSFLSPDFYTGKILGRIVEDFVGIRAGYMPGVYVTGNNAAYYPPGLDFINVPSVALEVVGGKWTRKEIGEEGQVLSVVDGFPEWQTLPPIPAEPSYPWIDIPFSAGDFTATGGGSWTVAGGNVARWQYQRFPGAGVGNNIRFCLFLETTTVVGAVTQLHVTIPFNIIGKYAEYISIQENGAAIGTTFIIYDEAVSTLQLTIAKVGGAPFDTTAGQTYIAFEISAVLAP